MGSCGPAACGLDLSDLSLPTLLAAVLWPWEVDDDVDVEGGVPEEDESGTDVDSEETRSWALLSALELVRGLSGTGEAIRVFVATSPP